MKVRMRFDQTHCLVAIRGFEHGRIADQFLENATQSVAYQGVIIDKKNFHLESSLTIRAIIFDTARESSSRRGGATYNNGFPCPAGGFHLPRPTKFPAPANEIPCACQTGNLHICAQHTGITARSGAGPRRNGCNLQKIPCQIPCRREFARPSIERPPEPSHRDRHRHHHESHQRGCVDLQVSKRRALEHD